MKSSLIIVNFLESRDALRLKSVVVKAEEVVKRRRRALCTDWKMWRKKAMESPGCINHFYLLFLEVDLCGLYIRLFFLISLESCTPYD